MNIENKNFITRMPTTNLRGSTIVLVTFMSVAIALIAAVLLRYSLSEMRLNRRNAIRVEAQNAAEATLEYAAAELATLFQANRNFSNLTLLATPLTAHGRIPTLFTNNPNSPTSVQPGSITLHVSNISTGFTRRIPDDNQNRFDPLRGQIVTSRNVRLLARATAANPVAGSTTVFSTQTFEVRDSRLFNYAIFYNLRMEFHPGPAMTVWGPVHSNENMHITTDGDLRFYDVVTSAQSIIAAGFNPGRSAVRNIRFRSGDPVAGTPPVTSVNGHTFGTSTNQFIDSLLGERLPGESFSERASQLYRGSVQDRSMGVVQQNPPGVTNPTEARAMIEAPDFSATANPNIEDQKFSRRAGIYIVVDGAVATNTTPPNVVVFGSAAAANAYKTSANRSAWLAANPTRVITPPAHLINPTRRMVDNRESRTINMIDINMGVMRNALQADAATPADQKFQVNGVDWDANADWTGAVYVEIENPLLGFTTDSTIEAIRQNASDTTARPGVGVGTGSRTAVRLVNAQRLPTLATINADAGLTFATNAPVYIAGHFNANGIISPANAAVPNGSERLPDINWDNGTPNNRNDDLEVPALVAGDSINLLSANWVDAAGVPIGDGRFANAGTANHLRRATPTEISAAFMAGIVETHGTNNNNYSGGVENYPRFHENWTSIPMLYRGSIVALYTSRFATARWGSGGNVYSPPNRRWGYHQFLADGEQPPFTPTLRTYRRIDFRDLSEVEYNQLLNTAQFGFIQM